MNTKPTPVRVTLDLSVDLEAWAAAYGAAVTADDVRAYVVSLVNGSPAAEETGLSAAIAVVAAPRKAAPATRAPVFATGDDALDEFMRRTWKPSDAVAAEKRRAAGMPKPAPLKPRKWTDYDHRMLKAFNEAAVVAWRRLGHEVIIEGGIIAGDFGNVRVLPLGESAVV